MKAFDYITTIKKPEVEEYPDVLGNIIAEGLMAYSPAERKSLQNNVGKAMELLLAEILGFEHTDIEGADISCDNRKIIAEVKNRYNTLNGGGRQRVIRVMKDLTLSTHHGYKKYLVVIHPRTSGLDKNIGQAITEISAARFCQKFGVDFKQSYLELVEKTAGFYGVHMPEIPEYYEKVVFNPKKRKKWSREA